MLEVLVDRVKAGVEVRVFYDDMGSLGFINTDFVKRMEALGISCRVFNPFAPGLNLFLNNRDHRKITVIDGKVGFTGGYNLANEYFHRTEPYGFWKDTGIRLEGDAVQSLTVTFLEMWNAVSEYDKDDIDYVKYLAATDAERVMKRRKKLDAEKAERIEKDKAAGFEKVKEGVMKDEKFLGKAESYIGSDLGFVQPYADSPMDDVHVGEDVEAVEFPEAVHVHGNEQRRLERHVQLVSCGQGSPVERIGGEDESVRQERMQEHILVGRPAKEVRRKSGQIRERQPDKGRL
jgi:hypothetical protein